MANVTGTVNINASQAVGAVSGLQNSFNNMFWNLDDGITASIGKFSMWKIAYERISKVTQELISESKDLIAVSVRYDIPISKMGELQQAANLTGQSVGQVARNLRFLEQNISKALLKPGSPQAQVFKQLDISNEQLKRGLTDTNYMLAIVRENLQKIGNEETRNNISSEIFGANWALMLPILEANKQKIADMRTVAHSYNEEITQSLTTIDDTTNLIDNELKPLGEVLAAGWAVFVNVIALSIVGVMTLGRIIKDAVIGYVKMLALQWDKLKASIKTAAGLALVASGNPAMVATGLAMAKEGATEFIEAQKKLSKVDIFNERAFERAAMKVDILTDRTALAMSGLGQAIGIEEEGAFKKDAQKNIDQQKEEIAKLTERLKKEEEFLAKHRDVMKPEEIQKYRETLIDPLRDAINERENIIKAYERRIERAKPFDGPKKSGGTSPLTAEQRKLEFDKSKMGAETGISFIKAIQVTDEYKEVYNAMIVAEKELLKIQYERERLKELGQMTPQLEAEYANKEAQANIKLLESKRAIAVFENKLARERADSEKDRRDIMIKSMQDRQLEFMTRQGMTGIDKQTMVFENAMRQAERDQAKYEQFMADPKRSQSEKLAAQKEMEGSFLTARKELDKLTLMQFQYGASDAAKKGMGGGIDIRENQLDISKRSLAILEKQLAVMMKQYGLTPDMFGNVPFIMSGAQRLK